ncbi:MAG TPA: DNA gyrase inhibitor YacG [Planctomycetota bacterium]|nr:DNA gyrase inhibitor YacG [Planctomycetota bacterium]
MAARQRSDATPRADRAPATCPVCSTPVARGARAFPFCSERCKLVDLGRWLGGRYRIEVPLETAEGGAGASGPPDEEPLSEGTP